MAAPVQTTGGLRAGSPTPLFAARFAAFFNFSRCDYAPAPDGQSFLINTRVGGDPAQTSS
jgi:hypothetical protein